jgi:pilus assembly protein CpaE
MALRILVSENDPYDTHELISALDTVGAVEIVGVAHDGLECAALAKPLTPDLALVRVRMAALDGYRVAQLIAQTSPRTLVVLVADEDVADAELTRRAMAAGARAVIGLHSSFSQVVALLRELTEQRPLEADADYQTSMAPTQLPITIAVTGSKGGIGKTTTAVNLALALQRRFPGMVVLVDFVGQYGDICIMLDLSPQNSIIDIADHEELDEDLLRSLITPHASGLHVLAGANNVDTLEAAEQITLPRVAQLLGALRRLYRVIILDVPALVHPLSGYIYQRSDHICMLTTSSDLTSVRSTAALLQSLLNHHVPAERIKLVVSRQTASDDYSVEQLQDTLRHPVAVRIPWAKEALSSAVNRGLPYVLAKPQSPPALAISQLAELLMKESLPLVDVRVMASATGEASNA